MVLFFFFNIQMIFDGIDYIDFVFLCGFGFDQVLVFVNGKCCYIILLVNVNGIFGRGNVGMDMNVILVLVIFNIEILCDGVVVQYGMDVIVGVINIKLWEDVN